MKFLKINTNRTLVKQAYVDNQPIFKEEAVGKTMKVSFFIEDNVDYKKIIEHWNKSNKGVWNYEFISLEEINTPQNGVYIHTSFYGGYIFDINK